MACVGSGRRGGTLSSSWLTDRLTDYCSKQAGWEFISFRALLFC